MDGEDILAELQTDPVTEAIPVVVLSADVSRRQIDRLLRLGARRYLTKPIVVDELLGVIDELAAGRHGP